jgi:hypothetical protein
MEQPGDGVLDELNKRVVAESLIEKSRSGRVTVHTEVTPKRQNGGYFRIGYHPPGTRSSVYA